MNLLLRLYPRAWRDRYGDEMLELLKQQPRTPSLFIDLISGAIDARLYPQTKGDSKMFAKLAGLRCAGDGPAITTQDQRRNMAVMLGGTLALTLVWMWLVSQYKGDPYVFAAVMLPFPAAYVLAMPFTSLKGRSRQTQVICVGATLLVLTAMWLVTGFIGALL